MNGRLLIVSPVKDEGKYLERTVRSMVAQKRRPDLWIIVDDGSSDNTAAIADRAAIDYPWIRVLHRPAGIVRRVGPGVVEAFYAGLESVNWRDYEFVCKLDGDLEFASTYFAELLERFDADPRLGTISGKTHIPIGDQFVLERTGDDFSHGVAKLYRRTCFEQIGGFVRAVMWDGIDCHRCRMLGWKAESRGDPSLAIRHLRQMGSSFRSIYHGRWRWGRGQYFMGTSLSYMTGIACYRMFERPWILGGVCLMAGYIDATIRRLPQYDDLDFRTHLQDWQAAEVAKRVFGTRTFKPLPPSLAEGSIG